MSNLPSDVTLADILTQLDQPEEFTRRVLQTMVNYGKQHGDLLLRLGITGNGRRPNYRLDSANTSQPLAAIDGNSHKPFAPHEDIRAPRNWSTQPMVLAEVQDVLGKIRGYERQSSPRA